MTDDELLRRMAKRTFDPRADDEDQLFERFALGELSSEEQRLLDRRVAEEPELAERRELYRPFSEDESRSFLELAGAQLSAPSLAVSPRKRWLAVAGFAAAMAAGLTLFWGTHDHFQATRATLPVYSVEVLHAAAKERSIATGPVWKQSDAEPARFSADIPPVFVLRPARAHTVASEVAVLVAGKDMKNAPRAWRRLPYLVERSQEGSLRVTIEGLQRFPSGTVGIAILEEGETTPTGFDPQHLRHGRDFLIEFQLSTPDVDAAAP